MKYSRFVVKNVFRSIVVAAAALVAVSCSSIPAEVPNDEREIVQLAQDAADKGNYKLSKWYYLQLLEKFPESPKIYVEANFEIAHLDIKKKNYDEAVPRLNEIIYIYANVAPGSLPGQYKKLAENDLAKVPEDVLKKINARLAAKDAEMMNMNDTGNDPANYVPESDFE